MDTQLALDVFINAGLMDNALSRDVVEEMSNSGKELWETLLDFGIISSPEDFWNVIATEVGAQYISLEGFVPSQEVLDMLPAAQARLNGALPVEYREGEGLYVCLEDPLNPQTVDDLRIVTGKDIYLYVAADYEVRARISEYYGGTEAAMGDLMNDLVNMSVSSLDGSEEANSVPIVRFVNLVITQAIKEKASDIHLEPFEHEFKIRYRVDGALYEMAPPPIHLAAPIISRVKVMAGMNIAEHRVPQDGRIMMRVGDNNVDMRVNSLPTQHGESVVMRVLDRNNVSLDLNNLNLSPAIHEYILDTVNMPNGIFVVTGPTGSGKTTLYAALREINTEDTKILTAEDPVEYDIDGIVQVPINEGIGVTFPRVLRAFLRQDPDRILVGEIRDQDTAQIAIQAALTGHLVLSTLHTNDAAGAVTRFIDMGVQPFLLAATLLGVLAQRLVRTICPYCKIPYTPSRGLLNQLGINPALLAQQQFFTGERCDKCGNTGYKGRKGIHELLNASEPIRELITKNVPSITLKQKAIELGMHTLREDGIQNIFDGHTTIEEVLRYT